MKITHSLLKVGLLTLLSCSLVGLTGCGGSEDAKKSSAAEVQAFKGSPPPAEAMANAKAQGAGLAAKGQTAAQAPPAPAPQ